MRYTTSARSTRRTTLRTLALVTAASIAFGGALRAQAQTGDSTRIGGMMGMMGMMSMMQNCPMMTAMAGSPRAALTHQKELGLSDAQVKQLQSLRTTAEQAERQAMAQMPSIHQELARATDSGRFDEQAARAALERMGTHHTQMAITMLRASHDAQGILTPQQREKLAGLSAAGMRRMMSMMNTGSMPGMRGMANMGSNAMESCPMMGGMGQMSMPMQRTDSGAVRHP